MIEIVSGIYQLPLPLRTLDPTLEHINSYLVQGDNGCLLVDTGHDTDETFDSLKKQLTEIGIGLEDITQVIATHCHLDHYGMAGRLRRFSKAAVALHYLDKDLLESRELKMDDYRQETDQWLHTNGWPLADIAELRAEPREWRKFPLPTLPDITFKGGETITVGSFSFQVLWTPGHSPGHICLYEPTQKILFSGDFILPDITPNISLGPHSRNNPLGDFINSLNMVKQLAVSHVLPAHGHPFTNLQQRVEELIPHHNRRNAEIFETIKTEPKTAYQIAPEVTWMPDIGGVSWHDLGIFEKRMAVLETLAHLESMRADGKINKSFRDGTIYYHRRL